MLAECFINDKQSVRFAQVFLKFKLKGYVLKLCAKVMLLFFVVVIFLPFYALIVIYLCVQDKSKVTVSQLSMVDLAGSERTSRTNTRGDRLKEASSINKALLVLRNCMETLRDNQIHEYNKV